MQPLDLGGLTIATENAALAAGTTTTYTVGGTFDYCIRGKAYTKTTASNATTPTTDGNTGSAFTALTASKGCCFVFGVNSSGTVSVYQGPIEDLSGEADGANASFKHPPQFPSIPKTICPFGYLVVKAGASASNWTMGSSNLSSVSNVAFAFASIMALPDRPQTS